MVSATAFVNLFTKHDDKTFSDFRRFAIVKIGNKTEPLETYRRRKHITLYYIELLYSEIVDRRNYLLRFYNTSLRVPSNTTIDDPAMPNKEMNNNKNVNYKNVIRNMFYLEILKYTQTGVNSVDSYINVLDNLYNKWIIDYKLVTPSSLSYIEKGRIGSVFSSLYFRASIMNPYLIYSLNISLLKGKHIFTPTLGWGSYLYGMAESGISSYVGVDVIPGVCNKVKIFAKEKYPKLKCETYCIPSEDLLTNELFIQTYKHKFDTVFFSPPYFNLELYQGGEQSTSRYTTYEEWLAGYWDKTMQLCNIVLHKHGKLCYIISDIGSEKSGSNLSLADDMRNIAIKYFKYKTVQPMYNKNVNVTEHRTTNELIYLFTKQ
jgi:hypothetical protein